MANNYILHYSKDSLKVPIQLHPRTINRTSSSVVLVGQGVHNYGEDAQENMLHMLEHFCSDISPTSPTEGQIWYDSTNKQLKVCIGFQVDAAIPAVNIADPNDVHYMRDVNGLRIPIWHTVAGSNGSGNKTISTEEPTGGSSDDIWYQV